MSESIQNKLAKLYAKADKLPESEEGKALVKMGIKMGAIAFNEEIKKAQKDALMFGYGFTKITSDGECSHVPFLEVLTKEQIDNAKTFKTTRSWIIKLIRLFKCP